MISHDNVTMAVDAVIYYVTINPVRATESRKVSAEGAKQAAIFGSPAQYLIAQKYLEFLVQIASNADKTVFLPYEASGALGALVGIKELLNKTAN